MIIGKTTKKEKNKGQSDFPILTGLQEYNLIIVVSDTIVELTIAWALWILHFRYQKLNIKK